MLISKQNSNCCHTRHDMHHMLGAKTTNFHSQLPPPHPPPPLPEWTGHKVWVLTAKYQTVPFLFGYISLTVWFLPVCFYSRSNCIHMVQQSMWSFFLSPSINWIVWIIICFKMQKTLKQLWKLSNHQLLRKKIKEYNNMLVWSIIRGTDMKMRLTLQSLASQRDLHFADCVGTGYSLEWQREIYFKKRKKRDLCWEEGIAETQAHY